nr:unnamed protein product [Callosobruchus chinensis]
MFMPLKPAEYGIKIMCMTDARNNYLYDGYIHCGKGSDGHTLSDKGKQFSIPSQAVIRLTKSITKTNRNVTADNWFSSIELVKELRNRGLTFVRSPDQPSPLSIHLQNIFYAPSNSTYEATDKPETISYYNSIKGGVDGLDQKCANYSFGRRTGHTPYKSRLSFLKDLAKSLTEPYMGARLDGNYLQKELHLTVSRVLGIRERGTCYLCDWKLKRTKYLCCCCKKTHLFSM